MKKKSSIRPLRERFVVVATGKKTAVIPPIKRYETLMEDLQDLAAVAERRDEEPRRLEAMKRRLKKDGLLEDHAQTAR